MKTFNIFCISLIISAVTLSSCSKESLSSQETDVASVNVGVSPNYKWSVWDLLSIGIEVEFGHRKTVYDSDSQQWNTSPCVESGLCKISIELGANPNDNGSGQLGFVDGDLVLDIDKASLTSSELTNNFSGGTIELAADLILDDDICNQLGLESGYTILAGDYPYVIDTDVVHIYF